MSTTVEGGRARPLNLSSFEDIAPGVPVVAIGRNYVTFDGDLTPEQASQVFARMESVDDTDAERRAVLRAAVTANDPLLPTLLACYVLGDPYPEGA